MYNNKTLRALRRKGVPCPDLIATLRALIEAYGSDDDGKADVAGVCLDQIDQTIKRIEATGVMREEDAAYILQCARVMA